MLAPRYFYGVSDVNRHQHRYGKPNITRITKISNKKYHGTAGDKAFLVRPCKCGKYEFFDYGSYRQMKAKLAALKARTPAKRIAEVL